MSTFQCILCRSVRHLLVVADWLSARFPRTAMTQTIGTTSGVLAQSLGQTTLFLPRRAWILATSRHAADAVLQASSVIVRIA